MTVADLDRPALPYGQGQARNSGWSGSDTSRKRAERRDRDGSTKTLQSTLLALVADSGPYGLTVAEARDLMPEHHHGSISGALSNLHKAARIARLAVERDGCQTYVLPDMTNGREQVAHGRKATQ